MDERADYGRRDAHVFFVGEVEAVEEWGKSGASLDNGYVRPSGDAGCKRAQIGVLPYSGEFLEAGAFVGGRFRAGR